MNNLSSILDVTNYGVVGDGITNNTKAVAAVIDKLEKIGGGIIYFPPGQFVCGSIILKSNMTLYLEGGCTILGSWDKEDYPFISEEQIPGYKRQGHTAQIAAVNASNITVTGRGTVDARGYNWWADKPDKKWHTDSEHPIDTYDEWRPRSFQPILCDNVRLEGITIKNSPMWTVHPMCCQNVVIDGISIKNPYNSPNTDGINPESCRNVKISNCQVDVGDDCVTIKSGTEDDDLQKQYPCENIVITNCTMLNGHGGVVIGSEMSGGVKNVTISNCVFNGTDRGIRIKTRRKRGGCVEDILVNNIMMTNVFAPITVNGYYQCGGTSPDDMELFSLEKQPVSDNTPVIKNISMSNIRAVNVTASAGYIHGIPESPVKGLRIYNYSVELVDTDEPIPDKPIMAWHVKPVKGDGIYCRFVEDAAFSGISIKTIGGTGITVEASEDVRISDLSVSGGDEVCIKSSENVTVNGQPVR